MAEPLKHIFSRELLGKLAALLHKADPAFTEKSFLKDVLNSEWESLTLKQRMRHVSHALAAHVPGNYKKQVTLLRKVAPAFGGLFGLVFPDFVEVYGIDEPDISLPALEYFTPYSSSEFAVRPFIIRYPERMYAQHLGWSRSSNAHVRRLASEGIRPRLPWGIALQPLKQDPAPVLPILENLKADESEYVRRSVANCLNDISKDHPYTVLKLIESWKGVSAGTDWIRKHASRGLLKKGHTGALASFGLDHRAKVSIQQLKAPASLKIGDTLAFSFDVQLLEKKPHAVRIEYRIYYVKAQGKVSPKIFQAGTLQLDPQQVVHMKRTHRFTDFTTRRHYSGMHRLAIVANGKELAECQFMLRD